MNQTLLCRQPIHDQDLRVFGYELLHRQFGGNGQTEFDGDFATESVLAKAFSEIGLDHLVGPKKAFINLTERWILSDHCLTLPKGQAVFEILEDVPPSKDVVGALRKLHEQGRTIALDDFVFDDSKIPLLEIADIVKLEVLHQDPESIKRQMDLIAPYKVKFLAEKVETYEVFEWTKNLGFDFFQGYFFLQPQVNQEKVLPLNQMAIISLLSKLQDPNIDIDDLDAIIKQDLALSSKILKYVNSAHFSLPNKVDSIPLAARMVGMENIKTWTILLKLLKVPNKSFELIFTGIVRAMMCEQLGVAMRVPDPEPYFTIGLYSVMDALFDLPMTAFTKELPLSEEAIQALIDHQGMMGATLRCVLSYERGDWEGINVLFLEPEVIQQAYFDALSWSSNLWTLLE